LKCKPFLALNNRTWPPELQESSDYQYEPPTISGKLPPEQTCCRVQKLQTADSGRAKTVRESRTGR